MSSNAIKLLALAGSTRTDSLNKRLLQAVVDLVPDGDAEVNLIDLRDYPLPLFDGDLEVQEGIPDNAMTLKQLFLDADALLISTPEYNTSLPAVLKNAIDWISRPVPDQSWLAGISGQVVGAMSASPGSTGGMSALAHLRQMFTNLGALVVPGFTACPNAGAAFNDDGSLANEAQRALYAGYMEQVLSLASWRAAGSH
ncbi:MAG: NADPH-dependent oxidoreductase [Gammaproteobacteria bacterium]|nr:MAG: NADPH-dependent oxidoreductase [Gammaproteobacteria bacterium]